MLNLQNSWLPNFTPYECSLVIFVFVVLFFFRKFKVKVWREIFVEKVKKNRNLSKFWMISIIYPFFLFFCFFDFIRYSHRRGCPRSSWPICPRELTASRLAKDSVCLLRLIPRIGCSDLWPFPRSCELQISMLPLPNHPPTICDRSTLGSRCPTKKKVTKKKRIFQFL